MPMKFYAFKPDIFSFEENLRTCSLDLALNLLGIKVESKEKNLTLNVSNYIVKAQEFKVNINKNVISKYFKDQWH